MGKDIIDKIDILNYITEIAKKFGFEDNNFSLESFEKKKEIENIQNAFQSIFNNFYYNNLEPYELLNYYILIKNNDLFALALYLWIEKHTFIELDNFDKPDREDKVNEDKINNNQHEKINIYLLPLNNIYYLRKKNWVIESEYNVADIYSKIYISEENQKILKISTDDFTFYFSYIIDKNKVYIFISIDEIKVNNNKINPDKIKFRIYEPVSKNTLIDKFIYKDKPEYFELNISNYVISFNDKFKYLLIF